MHMNLVYIEFSIQYCPNDLEILVCIRVHSWLKTDGQRIVQLILPLLFIQLLPKQKVRHGWL